MQNTRYACMIFLKRLKHLVEIKFKYFLDFTKFKKKCHENWDKHQSWHFFIKAGIDRLGKDFVCCYRMNSHFTKKDF